MECYLYRFPPSGGEAVVCRRLPPSMSLQNVLLHQSCPKTEDDRKLLYTLKNSVRAEWLQSCPTLCNPLDCSPSGSSIHGTLQARIVEWTVMPSSRGSSQLRDRTSPAPAGGFFTTSTTQEAHLKPGLGPNGSSPLPSPPGTTTQAQVHSHSLVCNKPKQSPWGCPGDTSGKAHACQCRRYKRRGLHPWVGKIPWRRKWQPTAVFLPGESHGKRSLAGYCPWDRRELSMTEATQHTKQSWPFPGGSAVNNPPAGARGEG